MPELRWTLLIIGVLFIVILAWWERRRPHQASRQTPHISGEPRALVKNDPSWGPDTESASPRTNPNTVREPALILPEIRTEVRTREPTASRGVPVVEIPGDAFDAWRADSKRDDEKAIAAEEAEEAEEEALTEESEAEDSAVPVVESMSAAESPTSSESSAPDLPTSDVPSPQPLRQELPTPEVTPQGGQSPQVPSPTATPVRPIVDWPPEDQRKLVSLRLVARPPERFRGSLVRQALAAEGFVLGELDIFHKPDSQNRSVLSAASLTRPGTFDLETMDTQRYVGLNLFAVLPGPRAPQKAFEDLLLTARMLNERLEGALQDERGGPLTPTRIQALRDAVGAEAKS